MKLNKYRFGFDVWGFAIFLAVMLPNFIWFAVPAPNDVLRTGSATPVIDALSLVFQILTVACLCFVISNERGKLRLSPFVMATIANVVVYYFGWALYYHGMTNAGVILLLTIPPCLAFILFAVDRKNLMTVLFATGFVVCHLIFALVNFIV